MNKPHETLGKKCRNACADAGYANTDELKKIDAQNIAVIVPSIKQAHGKEPKPFAKSQFRYDPESDCYLCPQGYRLTFSKNSREEELKALTPPTRTALGSKAVRASMPVVLMLLAPLPLSSC